MPAYGAAKTKAPELSIAHAHAAISTGTRQAEPPRHNVTSQGATSQCKREACVGHITANGTAPKVVGNEPTPAPDVVLNTPRDASRKVAEGSAAYRVSSYGCEQMRLRRPESFKDT